MNNIFLEAYKEGTEERIPLATMKQVSRMEKDGITFGDVMVFISNFSLVRLSLLSQGGIAVKKIKSLLEKEKKNLIFTVINKNEMSKQDSDETFYTEHYVWSIEDCNGGWYIAIAKC